MLSHLVIILCLPSLILGMIADYLPGNSSAEPGACCPCPNPHSTITPSSTTDYQVHASGSVSMVKGSYICHVGRQDHGLPARDDYKYSPGIGSHKFHTRASTWNEARKMCNDEGGHLAVINSHIEAHVLLEMFKHASPVKGAVYNDLAFIGTHDMYKEGDWVTILGESLFKSGYTVWSDKYGGQPDNAGNKQNCGALMKEGGMDDLNCDLAFAFFCELPMSCSIH